MSATSGAPAVPAGAVGQYAAVTAAYWGFTLTDGALRMLVLLHFHQLGYSPIELAFLFLLYEAMGVITNAFGGWLGSRHGLRLTLFLGLATQVVALVALSWTDPAWTMALSVAWVMGCQALSGIAKDLTKMSSKSAVKTVVPEGGAGSENRLFKWVALLTGSKNALKGVGFFLGGALLTGLGFQGALWAMAGALALVLLGAVAVVRADLGRAKSKPKGAALFSQNRSVNLLAAARLFLFASRDVWFVVGLPLFLATAFGWGFDAVGGFMALWIIGYGMVQASAPKLLRKTRDQAAGGAAALVWVLALLVCMTVLAALCTGQLPNPAMLMGGLILFGVLFAVNSAVHSWLVVSLADSDKVALTVGFYYMANAWGRLLGTLLSGLLYQWGLGFGATEAAGDHGVSPDGLAFVLWGSVGLLVLASGFTVALKQHLRADG